jgi:hypothetical protein
MKRKSHQMNIVAAVKSGIDLSTSQVEFAFSIFLVLRDCDRRQSLEVFQN